MYPQTEVAGGLIINKLNSIMFKDDGVSSGTLRCDIRLNSNRVWDLLMLTVHYLHYMVILMTTSNRKDTCLISPVWNKSSRTGSGWLR